MPFSAERPLKIALIGFMGSGKTTIGRALAGLSGLRFIDLDAAIEAAAGMSVAAIFAKEGEAAFRVRETDALRSQASRPGGMVLSCGGGVVVSAANRALLAADFTTVWLDVPFEELMRRLSDETEREARPLMRSEGYREKAEVLFRSRERLYREASRIAYRWKAGETAADAASAIAAMLDAAAGS